MTHTFPGRSTATRVGSANSAEPFGPSVLSVSPACPLLLATVVTRPADRSHASNNCTGRRHRAREYSFHATVEAITHCPVRVSDLSSAFALAVPHADIARIADTYHRWRGEPATETQTQLVRLERR